MPVLLLLALIVGVVVGLIRGGSLDALGRIQVTRPWLFGIAVVVLVAGRLLPDVFAASWVVATVAIALFAAANSRIPGLGLILVGVALNAAVILANSGHMPVSLSAADRAGVSRTAALASDRYVATDSKTVLRPVSDVIPLALPGVASVVSAGDVLVAAGLGLFGAVAPVRARRTLRARREARATGRFRRTDAAAP